MPAIALLDHTSGWRDVLKKLADEHSCWHPKALQYESFLNRATRVQLMEVPVTVTVTAFPRPAIRVFVFVGLCVGASQALLVSSSSTTSKSTSPCAQLQQWAQAYAGISPTLDHIAQYDRPHRVAIFNAVTPAVRSALWQEQLRRFDQRTDLSVQQHALINEGRSLATPAFYAHDPVATQAFQEFWPRVKNTFTAREHLRLWSDIGSVVRVDKFAASANGFCECNNGTPNYDCGGGSCPSGGCWQTAGCGPLGNLTCNGLCSS